MKEHIPNLRTSAADGEVTITTTDREKAEVLNSYFAGVFTDEDPHGVPAAEDRSGGRELTEVHITRQHIIDKIDKLKVEKSPGLDGVHPRVLTELKNELCEPLYIIFLNSVEQGKLPDEWKAANITALYKKEDKTSPGNYRPISLTSILCKLLESILCDHIVGYMKSNKLFDNNQYGFLKGRSTTMLLLKVMDEWTKILDERRLCECDIHGL